MRRETGLPLDLMSFLDDQERRIRRRVLLVVLLWILLVAVVTATGITVKGV